MSEFEQNLVLSVDVVLLSLKNTGLHFAVCERQQQPFMGEWSLPGGTVDPKKDANAEKSARRILLERTGMVASHMEQLATFSGSQRDPRGWSASIVHYALVTHDSEASAKNVQWRPVDTPGNLPFDHNAILGAAIDRLRSKALYSTLPLKFMPQQFTLPEMHLLYELVMNTSIDISLFRRIVLKSNILEPVEGQVRGEFKKGQVYKRRKKTGIDMFHTPLN